LAYAVYHEARSQSFGGQYKVAEAVLNRVADPRWPKTIEAVVRQDEDKLHRCQFSFMCDGSKHPRPIKDKLAWETAVLVAEVALEADYLKVKTSCAHSYHADYVTNKKALRWFATLDREAKVGRHIFYCD